MWWVSKVDSGNAFVFAPFAKTALIVKQTKFFDNVIHDQVCVDLWLVTHRFLIGGAQLTYLADVKSLIWVQFEHSHDNASQLWRIFLTQGRVLSFCNPLKQVV